LIYAERATKIKTKVVTRNVVNVDRHVGQYVEAINRLNQEVAELKEKLAGKKRKQEEIERRKKAEAIAEIEKAKKDLHIRAEQTQPSIMDGATCAGKFLVAQVKRDIIRARLMQIDAQASSSQGLSSDLEVERGLILSLLQPEEQILKPESVLAARVQRSTNSSNMFDAMLRAVVERRSDKLDEVCVENVKLDARWRKAEMERLKAEGQRDAVTQAASEQATMIVSLIGVVGKCAATLSETSRLLKTSIEEGRDGLDATVKAVIATLNYTADSNDEVMKTLFGQSGSMIAGVRRPSDVLNQYPIKNSHRSSGIGVIPSLKTKAGRRSVSSGSVGSPGRKTHNNSPRKPRTSATSIPHRRLSDKEKKKVVQWKDQAGKGDLVETGNNSYSISLDSAMDIENASSLPRSSSRTGSESEWEDEKTDDSLNISLIPPSHDILSTSKGKRPRSSRLDPNFLRFKGSSTLTSLAEDDAENDGRVMDNFRRISPLSDRNMNTVGSDTSSASGGTGPSTLHIPKGRDRHNSPIKRAPPTPRAVGGSRSGRRRSNIGPTRSEKTRRRSSLIPQLSPRDGNGSAGGGSGSAGPRRIALSSAEMSLHRSPGRKPKRLSLLTTRSISSAKPLSFADPNISITDISFRGYKPTWK
jgi:kinesin family protein 18/19